MLDSKFYDLGVSGKLKLFVCHDNYFHIKLFVSQCQEIDDCLWGDLVDKTRLRYEVLERIKLDYER